jgi:DNA recombination protein RmuC
LAWFINNKLSRINDQTDKDKILAKWLQSMQVSLEGTNRDMNDRLDNAARYISQVAREVGKMSELGQSMRDLQLFLQSPKIRGNIGEQVLKDLVSQAFPKGSFHLQYTFKSGEKVDAAIQTNAGILPIDSKFPMENFKLMNSEDTSGDRAAAKRDFIRDVKKHIQDISKKYILPDEGTLDFAFIYLPSEAVFNEVSNSEEILEFARRHRIYPVSPNTLYVHLQTVLLSFEGQKIEAKSRQVFRLLRAVQKDYEKTESVMQLLGKHLTNAYNQFSNVSQSFNLIGQKLS